MCTIDLIPLIQKVILDYAPLRDTPWRPIWPDHQSPRDLLIALARQDDLQGILLLKMHPVYRKWLAKGFLLEVAVASDSIRVVKWMHKVYGTRDCIHLVYLLGKYNSVLCCRYFRQICEEYQMRLMRTAIKYRSYAVVKWCRVFKRCYNNPYMAVPHMVKYCIDPVMEDDDLAAMIKLATIACINPVHFDDKIYQYGAWRCYRYEFGDSTLLSQAAKMNPWGNIHMSMWEYFGIPVTVGIVIKAIWWGTREQLDYLYERHSNKFHAGLFQYAHTLESLKWFEKQYGLHPTKKHFLQTCKYGNSARTALVHMIKKYRFGLGNGDLRYLVKKGCYESLEFLRIKCGYSRVISYETVRRAYLISRKESIRQKRETGFF